MTASTPSSPFALIEEFLAREWPGSRLDDGYALAVVYAPVSRRFEPAQPEYPELAARRELTTRAFQAADQLWLVSVGLDPAPFTGPGARVEHRDAWTTPDAGIHQQHAQYAAIVSPAGSDLDGLVARAARGPHYLLLLDPERKLAIEPGWMARPLFAHASSAGTLDALQALARGRWGA